LEEISLSIDTFLWVSDRLLLQIDATNIHDRTHRKGLTVEYFFSYTTSGHNSCYASDKNKTKSIIFIIEKE